MSPDLQVTATPQTASGVSKNLELAVTSTPERIAAMVDDANARIRSTVQRTPVVDYGGASVKCENLQETGSFKLRGALNKLLALRERGRAGTTRVVAASTGNHGRAVAHALQIIGGQGTIFLPMNTPAHKIEALRRYSNVTLELVGDDSGDTEAYARRLAEETGAEFISPYNDAEIIAGQGTIAIELLEQVAQLESVYVAVGGGGLISGIAARLKAARPDIRIVGCWPENSVALYAALRGESYEERATLSDATAGGIEEVRSRSRWRAS